MITFKSASNEPNLANQASNYYQGAKYNKLKMFLAAVLILALGVSVGVILEKSLNTKQDTAKYMSTVFNIQDNEIPTIAQVTNLESLQSQVFFKDAKLNDEVIVYALNNIIILYRPSENKIINFSKL